MKFEGMLAGRTQRLNMGTEYSVKATLEFSKKYKNYNYVPISVGQDLPKSVDDQKKFLQSVCTPLQAETLLEQYPDAVQMIVDGRDGEIDLNKTKGIKEITFENIKNKVLDNYAISDILSLLIPLGISFSKIRKLLGGEPNPTILKDKILDDPYILSDIPGISWKLIDGIATGLNPDFKTSKKRIISFIKNYLKEVGESDGHTFIYKEELIEKINNSIQECENFLEEILSEQEEYETFLHIEDDKIGLHYYWYVEKEIYRILKEINESEPIELTQEEIDNGIANAEKELGFTYTDEQREILINCTKSNLTLITGKAGTGKTSLTRGLLNIYKNHPMVCTALSAKAAKRINEITGFVSSTIHRALGAKGLNSFVYNKDFRMGYDVNLVDEMSMTNNSLFYDFISAMKIGSKLILCGDPFQIPAIGAGAVFSDILEKDIFNANKLTKILRQSEDSGIVVDANKIRDGISPIETPSFKEVHGLNSDMVFMFRSDRDELNRIAIDTYLKTIKDVGIDNCYILTTRREGCINSSREISKRVQDILIPDDVAMMKYGENKIFKLGARVIHTSNDYDTQTFNGDMGTITSFGKDEGGEFLEVTYPEKTTTYYKGDLKKLELSYCLSTHRFQGSEAKVIIGIIDNNGFLLLSRPMLYTLITRGKEKVLLLAEPFAYNQALKEENAGIRKTWMKGF
jgi:exodeoxyribonuclease V alpha subunit